MTGFMLDDLAREPGLGVERASGTIADLAGELRAGGGRWPGLFFDRDDRAVRATVMLRLGLGHVAKTGGLRTLAGTVTARASRGQPERVADSAIPAANPTTFRGHRERSFPERGKIA